MVDHNDDDDLDDEVEGPEEEIEENNNFAVIKLHPEDIDSIFDAVHNGIDLLHTVMANVYKNYQQKVIDYDVLKTEVDTKDAELKKYKDKLLEIYSQQATKPIKRKGKKTNEL